MPLIRKQEEADRYAAEMLRKMADFVERGEAFEVNYARVAATWVLPAEQVEVEYVMRIKVREVVRQSAQEVDRG